MNWDSIGAIGAIGEIVSAVAVVVSILYLSIQIRSNTKATKASASFDATHSWALSNEQMPLFSDEMIEVFHKTYDQNAAHSDFSTVENIRALAHHRALLQKLEGQYFLYKYGYLDPGVWAKRSKWAHGLI